MSLVSDGLTIYTAPFVQTNTSFPVFTLFCWVKYTTVSGAQNLLSVADPTAYNVSLIKSGSTNNNSAIYNDDSANSRAAAESGLNPSAGVWYPLCGLFSYTASTATLITPRETTTNTTTSGTLTTSHWSQIQFLARIQTGSTFNVNGLLAGGQLAEVAIWTGLLSSAEYTSLVFNQLSPWRVRQSSLVCYLPLRMNAYDYGPLHLPFTAVGASATTGLGCTFTGDHPIPAQVTSDTRYWMLLSGAKTNYQTPSASNADVAGLLRQPALRRGAIDAQVAGYARTLFGLRSFGAASSEIASVLRNINWQRGAADAQAIAFARQTSATRLLSGSSVEATALQKQLAAIRSAADAQVTTVTTAAAHRSALAAAQAQVAALAEAFLGFVSNRALSATNAQSMLLRRGTSLLRGAADAQSVAFTRLLSIFRTIPATSSESLAATKAVGLVRQTTDAQAAAASRHLAIIRAYFVSTTEMLSLVRNSAKILSASSPAASILARAISLIRGAFDAQVAALFRAAAHVRGLSAADAQVASEVASTLRHRAVSAFDAQVAALVETYIHAGANTGQALAAISTQVAAISKASWKLLGTGSAQAWIVARQVAARRVVGNSNPQATGLLRQPSKILTLGAASLSHLSRVVGAVRSISNPSTASLSTFKSRLVALADAQAQGTSLLRLASHFKPLSAAASTVVAVLRTVGWQRSVADAQVTARRIGVSKPFAAALAESSAMAVPSGQKSGMFAAANAETIALSRRINHLAGVLASSVVALAKNLARSLSVSSPSGTSNVRWYHQYLPLILRSRVVLLPFAWADVTLPRLSRTVVLPPSSAASTLAVMVRKVLLPLEENDTMLDSQIHRPEPDRFSPFDPTDEDQFTFDWTRRAYPNDTITFASITSVPAGVSFLGPAFIDGLLVEVTIGPFTPPALPMTYRLRCQAVFASGRISNYSVPFVVMNL